MVVKQRNFNQKMLLKRYNLFKCIEFLGLRNSEKSLRKTFFDEIDEFIPYPANYQGYLLNEDYSVGVANGEIIIFTFDYQGFVFVHIVSL